MIQKVLIGLGLLSASGMITGTTAIQSQLDKQNKPLTTQTLQLTRHDKEKTKLAFGSCYGMLDAKGDIFKSIGEYEPDLWMWLGDAAYTDNFQAALYKEDNSMPEDYVTQRFKMTLNDPYYSALMEKTEIIGVWDDHDYGANNADYSMKQKHVNREIFLDFIGEPRDSIRRKEKHRGIYQDYIVYHDDVKVHLILLDGRFHYNQDEYNERLGKLQTEWLEQVLSAHQDADLTFIMNGNQILPDRYKSYIEVTGQKTKQNIMNMIKTLKKSGVVFLSGDVHYAQLFNSHCASLTGYKIHEVCSSGLTHVLSDMYFNVDNNVDLHTPDEYKSSDIFMGFNYASIEIEKVTLPDGSQDIQVDLDVKDFYNKNVLSQKLFVKKDLQYNEEVTRYSEMCHNLHYNHNLALVFIKMIKSFVESKNPWFYVDLYIFVKLFMNTPLVIIVQILYFSFSLSNNKSKKKIKSKKGSLQQQYEQIFIQKQ